MNRQKIINEIELLSKSLSEGKSVIDIIGKFDGNWDYIYKELQDGSIFSDCVKKHPFSELSVFDNTLLCELINCGELGGVLEITLNRFVKYMKDGKEPYSVIGFLNTVGLMISCGVPILTAIRNCPIGKEYIDLKDKLYHSIIEGKSFHEPFIGILTDNEIQKLKESEYNGYLPEYLMTNLI